MAQVIVNVKANTSDATKDVKDLDKALEGADVAAEALNDSLEAQENRIKTLGGAINIVGGSVEVLAGGLALTGGLTEEQAERFESAAIGAIAFADGTKRVFEGVKELNEGLKAYGGISGVAAKAVGRLNTVIRANPYVAAATALAALAAGIAVFIKNSNDADDESSKLNRTLDEQIDLYNGVTRAANGSAEKIRNLEARAKALNSTFEEQLEIDRQSALEGEARAIKEINALEDALLGTRKIDREETEKQLELAKKRRDNAREFLDLLFDTEAAYADIEEKAKNAPGGSKEKPVTLFIQPKVIVPEGEKEVSTIAEYFDEVTSTDPPVLRPVIAPDYTEADLGETTLLERAEVLGGKIGEAISSQAGQAIGTQLEAASQLTSALVEVIDDGTEEGFEASKKYKIAEVITSSTQAAFQAFAAAQQFGPILGPILGTAQVAAITVAANRAIGDIKSSTFGGDSIAGGAPGSVSAPFVFGQGTTTSASGATGTLAPTLSTSAPIKAYVVSSEIRDAADEENAIRRRRTL